MSDNLAEAFNNLKKMVDSGNIPSEVQGMINNLNNSNSDSKQTLNNMLSQVSPEMLNNPSSMLNSSNLGSAPITNSGFNDTVSAQNKSSYNNFSGQNNNSSSTESAQGNGLNLDMATLMKMTSIINKMNSNDSASKNLLQSLKPYLRDSRKDKLDQYSNLLNVAKIAEVMKNDKKENN